MSEIKPMALIESMCKKVCMHSDVYFRTNKRTGKVRPASCVTRARKSLLRLRLRLKHASREW